MNKTPTLQGPRRGHGIQPYLQFIGEANSRAIVIYER